MVSPTLHSCLKCCIQPHQLLNFCSCSAAADAATVAVVTVAPAVVAVAAAVAAVAAAVVAVAAAVVAAAIAMADQNVFLDLSVLHVVVVF